MAEQIHQMIPESNIRSLIIFVTIIILFWKINVYFYSITILKIIFILIFIIGNKLKWFLFQLLFTFM